MKYTLTIPYTLPGLNEYTSANRSNAFQAAKFKKDVEGPLIMIIQSQLRGIKITKQVNIKHWWYEKNQRRDKDNIAFAKKFIWDALVRAGTLKNDGWKEIAEFRDFVLLDQVDPRVVVEIEEV
jgi:Holliday junction resolvase RusA-like endonuclease